MRMPNRIHRHNLATVTLPFPQSFENYIFFTKMDLKTLSIAQLARFLVVERVHLDFR